jgi:hypothetical protein
MVKDFDADAFYAALERSVRSRGANWKMVSQDTGVSQTTLTRMGQGRRPDAASMATLSAWAGINPADYVGGVFGSRTEGGADDTIEQISQLLRKDEGLTDEARRQMTTIVESAYNALKKTGER